MNFQSLFHSLFINFGMFAGLFTLLTILPNFFNNDSKTANQSVIGLLFGLAAGLSILFSVEIMPGIIIDSRVTILTMAGLFFGSTTAIVAAVPAIIARLFMGGSVHLGIIVIIFAALFGVLCKFLIEIHMRSKPNMKFIMLVSLLVSLIVPLISVPFIDFAYKQEILTIMLPAFVIQTFISTAILGSLLMISYQNQFLETKIGQVETMASKVKNAKTEFLAMMSHEIRTPMNGVLGFTEILGQTDLDDYQKHCVKQIKTAGTTMMHLLDDILDFSRIDSGKFSLAHTPVNLIASINSTYEIMKTESTVNNNTLILNVDNDVPHYIYGDTHRIRQILFNLLGNALKFTENGQVELSVTREDIAASESSEDTDKDNDSGSYPLKNETVHNKAIKSVQQADGIVCVKVKDNGIGIALEKQQAIFSAFEQEDSSTSRKYGGSGLGLAIVKKLVTLMGGTIELESYVGKGTTFTLKIPYIKPDEKDRPQDDDNRILSSSGIGSVLGNEPIDDSVIGDNRFILLAEDIEMNQELAVSMLMQNGFQVHVANNGQEAVEAVKNNGPFHLVLMDIRMPVMNGIEATRYIRKDLKLSNDELPIVALTAHVMGQEIKDCLKAGMDDYVSKPIKVESLLNKVAQWAKPAGVDSFDSLLTEEDNPSSSQSFIKNIIQQSKQQNETEEAESGASSVEDFVTNPFANITPEDSPLIDQEMLGQFMDFMGKDKIIDVFEVFKTDVEQRFKEIETSNLDLETIKNETHALASTSGNLGMIKFSLSCREFVDMDDGVSLEVKEIEKRVSALQDLADESCDEFSRYIS